MECPYCGQEMEDGYLQCSRGMMWSREIKEFSIMPDFKKGDIVACNAWFGGWMRANYLPAQFCRRCNLLQAAPPKDQPHSIPDLLKGYFRTLKENT